MSHIIQTLQSVIGCDCPTVLEIGSCEGEDSIKFLRTFPTIRLFCFEPDPANCNKHRRHIQDARCQLIEAAITNEDKNVVFHRSGGRSRRASGSLRQPKDHLKRHPWCKFDEDIVVPGITLDTWCSQNQIEIIDLIWADVNGAETSMIAGGQQALSRTRYLYTEFGPNNAEIYEGGVTKSQIIALLPQFEEVLVHSNNVLLRNKKLT